ncbi:MAG: hypothetical protein JRN51_10235 [Nitrososphaerota archaeon]|nr:hypothetical protein [Nitrososphaerota archaeon]MDG6966218.1 hypothetical protein [Nitrososphaerota archaeon]MDG6977653.1 hypothetical protein [Nitrososphaerota archaeon]MDG6981472.1 hypothetical protein [Nitrososphaerota archaeon]MDG7021978.1 hypothetical protein [Nitrososphaerota archaeon]
MGWFLKVVALLLAFVLVGAGTWSLALIIFAALLLPPVFRLLHRSKQAPQTTGKKGRLPARYLLAGTLLVLAFAGYLAHGSFSPLAFGTLGLVVLLWGRLAVLAVSSSLKPVNESILLRSTRLQASWAGVARVTSITRDLGRALAGVSGTVILSLSDVPAVYVVVERKAWSEKAAEEEVLSALRELTWSLAPRGAYLLPLDSQQAYALFQPSFEAARFAEADLTHTLASGSHDLISLRQSGGFARALGLYRRTGGVHDGKVRIPLPERDLSRQPVFLEVFKAIGGRLSSPSPDQYTAFLSSLYATSGEPVGTRVFDGGTATQSGMMLVKSQGSPPVELSKAQLRAVVRIYEKAR